jgi:hypothetical protein
VAGAIDGGDLESSWRCAFDEQVILVQAKEEPRRGHALLRETDEKVEAHAREWERLHPTEVAPRLDKRRKDRLSGEGELRPESWPPPLAVGPTRGIVLGEQKGAHRARLESRLTAERASGAVEEGEGRPGDAGIALVRK